MCVYAYVWWFILTHDYYISTKIWLPKQKKPNSAPELTIVWFTFSTSI